MRRDAPRMKSRDQVRKSARTRAIAEIATAEKAIVRWGAPLRSVSIPSLSSHGIQSDRAVAAGGAPRQHQVTQEGDQDLEIPLDRLAAAGDLLGAGHRDAGVALTQEGLEHLEQRVPAAAKLRQVEVDRHADPPGRDAGA